MKKYRIKFTDGRYMKGLAMRGADHYIIQAGKEHAAELPFELAKKLIGTTRNATLEAVDA